MTEATLRDRTSATPTEAAPLTEDDAAARVASQGFVPVAPGRVGAEVEWHLTSRADRRRRIDPESVKALLGVRDALPRRTRLTFEPGGALELSTRPGSLREGFDDLEADRARIGAALAEEGLELVGLGLDPVRLPRRVVRSLRYQAMEELFDQDGRAGRWMMANTASVQVCLDTGLDGDSAHNSGPGGTGPVDAAAIPAAHRLADRWSLAHRLAPVLIAAFANSPLRRGEPTVWRSTRQHVWAAVDPTRSRPVPAGDPREAWARYALDARVMAVRGPDRWTVPRGLTFRDWLRGNGPRPPTRDDLDYHLTTLFPPVRPRGPYLELRMIDAQPGPDWIVPVAVAAALLDHPAAAAAADAALEPLWDTARADDLYRRAATAALRDGPLAAAALACFTAARDAQGDPAIAAAVDRFTESFVARARTRADDLVSRTA